ncbi:MAG: adenosylmethionine--8-amino-7-oxononanoate transaminase [Verrucomicrobiota bacterium]|nr:adenosylmethionine--8-amino-7-oxononanoate transaminase [Verrucomicrobiota bacterium]
MNEQQWRRRSTKVVWHPYTDIAAFEKTAFPVVRRASESTLYEWNGRPLLDGISSWWCVNLGHSHPRLVRAIRRQAGLLQHTMLGGVTHPAAVELAERLTRLAPKGLRHVMFGSDGSMAVEAALKMALQYWTNRGETERARFIALKDGYHGDSLGAVGVGYVPAFHRPFRAAARPAWRAESPHCNRCPRKQRPDTCGAACFASMEELVRERHRRCAAVIVEPLCQAAAGMRIYPAEYLRRLRALCDRYGLLLIADEIAVGFGRAGTWFACDQADIRPDIMTVGKGLTAGMLPMSATLATDAVYDTFRSRDGRARVFCHGATFCGNPIAGAAALAALDTYKKEKVLEGLPARMRLMKERMAGVAAALDDSPLGALGMIAAVEIKDSAGGGARALRIARLAREAGLLVRPLGRVIYLWPPLTVSLPDLWRMTEILRNAALDSSKNERLVCFKRARSI